MKIIFFGSSQFAVEPFCALIGAGYDISLVVTQPDRKKGRHLLKSATAVKEEAVRHGLSVFQPEDINCEYSLEVLKSKRPDLFVVVAYGQILSAELLCIPKLMPLNIHASLLPKYRGAAPINWALINGEKKTGITIMKLIRKMDAGPVILQEALPISAQDDAVTLEEKLSRLGSALLLRALSAIKTHEYRLLPQNEKSASLAPKLEKKDGLIDWRKPAREVCDLVRGCVEWPGAFTHYKGRLLKIYKAEISSKVLSFSSSKVGQIMEVLKDRIVVSCGRNSLAIEELQIEGRRRMTAEEFIVGHKISVGEILA